MRLTVLQTKHQQSYFLDEIWNVFWFRITRHLHNCCGDNHVKRFLEKKAIRDFDKEIRALLYDSALDILIWARLTRIHCRVSDTPSTLRPKNLLSLFICTLKLNKGLCLSSKFVWNTGLSQFFILCANKGIYPVLLINWEQGIMFQFRL